LAAVSDGFATPAIGTRSSFDSGVTTYDESPGIDDVDGVERQVLCDTRGGAGLPHWHNAEACAPNVAHAVARMIRMRKIGRKPGHRCALAALG